MVTLPRIIILAGLPFLLLIAPPLDTLKKEFIELDSDQSPQKIDLVKQMRMSLSYMIIKEHGGKLEVENKIGVKGVPNGNETSS